MSSIPEVDENRVPVLQPLTQRMKTKSGTADNIIFYSSRPVGSLLSTGLEPRSQLPLVLLLPLTVEAVSGAGAGAGIAAAGALTISTNDFFPPQASAFFCGTILVRDEAVTEAVCLSSVTGSALDSAAVFLGRLRNKL